MMRLLIRLSFAATVVLGLLGCGALAGEPSAPAKKAPMAGCPCCQGMAASQPGTAPARMMDCPKMQLCAKAGMPNALLALKDKLGLSEDQVAKLDAIFKKAKDEALGVLTSEQKSTLDALPAAAPPPQTQSQPAPRSGGCCPMMRGGDCPMMR